MNPLLQSLRLTPDQVRSTLGSPVLNMPAKAKPPRRKTAMDREERREYDRKWYRMQADKNAALGLTHDGKPRKNQSRKGLWHLSEGEYKTKLMQIYREKTKSEETIKVVDLTTPV